MATHDYVIANASGAAVRADLNNALAAIVSNNSGSSEPSTTYAFQWWADTSASQLKLRNAANDDWITINELDGTLLMENGSASAPGLAFGSDLNTGFFRPGADQVGIATGGTSRLQVDSGGRVGIGVAPSDFGTDRTTLEIHSSGTTVSHLALTNSTTGSNGASNGFNIVQNANDTILLNRETGFMSFSTANTERMRIDSSGRLLHGTSTAPTVCAQNFREILSGTDFATTGKVQIRYDSDTQGPTLLLTHARGTEASPTALANNDQYGKFRFVGHDGTDFTNWGAEIAAFVDGTPGSDDMPGRLVFSTTADGDPSPTERLRIDSSGRLLLGTTTEGEANSDDLTIASSGSTGITIRSGTSSYGSIYFSDATSGAGEYDGYLQYNQSSRQLAIGTASATQMTVDSAGRVGIGVTPSSHGTGRNSLELHSPSATVTHLSLTNTTTGSNGGSNGFNIIQNGNNSLLFNRESGFMSFSTASTERARITDSGNLGVGTTSPGGRLEASFDSSSIVGLVLRNSSTGTSAQFFSGSSIVGSITVTGSATAFNTSSDYRLKENVVDIADGISRVKQLQPKRFNFIADADTTVDGFLAHEAQTVVPEAVTGEKDGEEMQGIDQSKLVPLLTAALQEAIAKIETLEAKVAALEAG